MKSSTGGSATGSVTPPLGSTARVTVRTRSVRSAGRPAIAVADQEQPGGLGGQAALGARQQPRLEGQGRPQPPAVDRRAPSEVERQVVDQVDQHGRRADVGAMRGEADELQHHEVGARREPAQLPAQIGGEEPAALQRQAASRGAGQAACGA